MDGNGNAFRNYPTNYHANPENGQIFAQKEITNFNYNGHDLFCQFTNLNLREFCILDNNYDNLPI